MAKKKQSTISVDSDDLENELRSTFNTLSKRYNIPKGKLLSRALYLACLELEGKERMEFWYEQFHAQQKDPSPRDKAVIADSKSWLASVEERVDQTVPKGFKRYLRFAGLESNDL